MRKRLILALVAFLTLLTLATPSRAQVPAPKVTITGHFDRPGPVVQVTPSLPPTAIVMRTHVESKGR